MQEMVAGLDAVGADQHVDGLAHGDAEAAQGPTVGRRLSGDIRTDHRLHDEAAQRGLDLPGLAFVGHALQHLAQHQVIDDNEGGAIRMTRRT